jgi:acyl-CoA thioesterase FadM
MYWNSLGKLCGRARDSGLPVVALDLKFLSPVSCGDQIEIETRISRMTQRRIYFKLTLENLSAGRTAVTAKLTVAAFGMDYKYCPIPDFIVRAINDV